MIKSQKFPAAVAIRMGHVVIGMVSSSEKYTNENQACPLTKYDSYRSSYLQDNADVTVDENSCVGFYACSYIGSNETDSTAVTLSIGKESCLGGRACSYVRHDCPEDSGMECSEPSCECLTILVYAAETIF
jgi:hypothetical protein